MVQFETTTDVVKDKWIQCNIHIVVDYFIQQVIYCLLQINSKEESDGKIYCTCNK